MFHWYWLSNDKLTVCVKVTMVCGRFKVVDDLESSYKRAEEPCASKYQGVNLNDIVAEMAKCSAFTMSRIENRLPRRKQKRAA